MTELCLQRSLNVPLTVKIFRERDPGDSNLVLDVVMASSDRWKIADVYMGFPLLQQIGTLHSRLSTLSTLLISLDFAEFEFDVDVTFWKVLEIAPQLTTLIAHSWGLDRLLPVPFSLPWHQLTRLSTTFTSNTEALYMLQDLSDIIECKLAFGRAGVLPSDLSLKIHLPHLRFLALQIE
ncbi:hypothetical protein B0H19DRAFT_1270076 [Mycena capillaripes]|nr:hypothetical protein B0H19DRAFT_1270076 [Mycena capillaripes]